MMGTTGNLPPNCRNGQAFVNDPNIHGVSEVPALSSRHERLPLLLAPMPIARLHGVPPKPLADLLPTPSAASPSEPTPASVPAAAASAVAAAGSQTSVEMPVTAVRAAAAPAQPFAPATAFAGDRVAAPSVVSDISAKAAAAPSATMSGSPWRLGLACGTYVLEGA